MNRDAVIIGSGKTARDIGLLFLQRGFDVTWIASPAYAEELKSFVHRKLRQRDDGLENTFRIALHGEALRTPPDLIIESRAEDRETKQATFRSVQPHVTPSTLLLSNSSSILPNEIGDDIAGMHFFYPTALTLFVELVFPDPFSPEKKARLRTLARELDLEITCQNPQNAFFVNRLLLPLQAETMRLFLLGAPVARLDVASRSVFMPVGQLSTADEIGLDVLIPGMINYVRRMNPDRARDYASLITGLSAWRDRGILGKKNKRRILKTPDTDLRDALDHLPHPEGAIPNNVQAHLLSLFLNTCLTFFEQGECDEDALSSALSAVFGADQSVAESVRDIGPQQLRDTLARAYEETGISYFAPSPLLTDGAM